MKEGILGVLGGMGPQATNTFYQRIIDRTQAESDQEHLRVLIWSDAKIPDRTAGILGGDAEAVYETLLADARNASGGGGLCVDQPNDPGKLGRVLVSRYRGDLRLSVGACAPYGEI